MDIESWHNMKQKGNLKQHNKWMIWVLILLITLFWGYAWVLMKDVLLYMGPFTFSAFRFGIGTFVLIMIVWIFKYGAPPKRYWKHLLIVGLLQTAAAFLLVMYGLSFVGAGKSSVLFYTMPIWSSLLAIKFLKEKLDSKQIIGLFIGLVGLLTILGWDIWVVQNVQVIFGEILIVIAAFAWGIANVYYRIYLNDLPKIQASAFQMMFGTIAIILVAFIMEWGEPIEFTAASIFYIGFTGILASAFCFTAWYIVLSHISMVSATLATLLVPIFGLLLSTLILGEQLTVSILIGSGLIIFGIVIGQLKTRNVKPMQREKREPLVDQK